MGRELPPRLLRAKVRKQYSRPHPLRLHNPPLPLPAGFLIESVNLKSHLIGDAIISPKHANFIINLGQDTSADIVSLMELAKKRVRERYGVILNPEVQFLGSMEK